MAGMNSYYGCCYGMNAAGTGNQIVIRDFGARFGVVDTVVLPRLQRGRCGKIATLFTPLHRDK